ncbi:hypothetical protein FD722_17520 [Photobacterium damselae subsp. damselae]|uniref:hypothetical protein n=1 Tax=Photobacterium damselae TaxID=38293 RepID=UPI0010FF6067|nr:hypothetical protein [Photobacterium damselae]TLS80845.1 hypothetical protein FD719_17535 [Photobacterium damselae subsp. damselae]TLS87218.1 hypothetical protein FD722_17520 [Photobacterium damselae subsp. damselae]
MIYIEHNPIVDFSLMDCHLRKDGLSGFIRAKNEGEYIYQVISSWLQLVDELIIVFNDCSDNTEDEIKRAIKDFSTDKIKAYKYMPKVYPQGSKEHIELPPDNIHSLVNYYNYALSKTTKKHVVKVDGDIIYDPVVRSNINKYLKEKSSETYYKLHGVNLVDNFGEIYVPSNSMFCGMNGDLCIFPVSLKTIFKHKVEFEYLDLSSLKDGGGCYAYYHMKFVKNDMGFSNYALKDNPNSRYVRITKNFIIGLDFLPVNKVNEKFGTGLRLPNDIGIYCDINRDFIGEYKDKLSYVNVNINKIDIFYFYIRRFLSTLKQSCKK